MTSFLTLLVFIMMSEQAPATGNLETIRSAETNRINAIAQVEPTVVSIFTSDRGGGGSGVMIASDGFGLTNFHVLAPMLETKQGLGGLSDGRLYPLKVLGVDPTGDVAMFMLTGKDHFDYAPLGDSGAVQVGDRVFAMGNPFMLAEDFTPTVTCGIVSGLGRYQYGSDQRKLVYTDCIQIDAAINPGNSGGPLFDLNGRLIGINGRASFKQRGRVNVGLAYAISVNQIKRFLPGLQAGHLMEHGTLGATTKDLGYRQVVFDKVLETSAASQIGITTGDRLIRFAGHEIHSSNRFANVLGTFPAGWAVEVVFEREGRRFRKTLQLDRLPVDVDLPFERETTIHQAETSTLPASHPTAPLARQDNEWSTAIREAQLRTVKLYGAQIGEEPGYATGIIVSHDGHVVTVLSTLLEARRLRTCTHDGRFFETRVLYRDEYRQLALLKMVQHPENIDTSRPLHTQMEQTRFEAFDLHDTAPAPAGKRVLAIGNPFKVAEGAEPLSILEGIIAGHATMDAMRGVHPFPYRGPILLIDAITSNPGMAGGAIVDAEGRCLGLIGKTVTSRLTNTYLNYAYPNKAIQVFLIDAQKSIETQTRPARVAVDPGYHGIQLSRLGYRKRLPFVSHVDEGSPAEAAGIRPDDLVISVNGVAIPRARVFREVCDRLHAGDTLSMVVKRDNELITVRLTLREKPH